MPKKGKGKHAVTPETEMGASAPPPSAGDTWMGPNAGSYQTAAAPMELKMEDDDGLPHERNVIVPDGLVASFEMFKRSDANSNSHPGDKFNDLGHGIPRDASGKVLDNNDLVKKVNDYEYTPSLPGRLGGWFACLASCGMYYCYKRTVIPDGYFGHFVSSGQHKLVRSGIHSLISCTDKWLDKFEVDGEDKKIRVLGSKIFLTVPENHIGGGFRIGMKNGNEDGTFVLFNQGRYILKDTEFAQIDACPTARQNKIRIGPVTILYVKEGFLGGAYLRNEGVYRVLPPGPPYILHDKDFEDIVLVRRTIEPFTLSPYFYCTIKDGQLGGATHKATGRYQLLPPGNTYRLHSKDYEAPSVRTRSEKFELGPFTFVTVKKGYICGAYRKKGGEFVILPQGFTYQLNEEDFEHPELVKKDKHIVTCGPLTFLTVANGFLSGAYSTGDGKFVEFADPSREYILHQKEYHGLVTIKKYSYEEQRFGPNLVVTIPDGHSGVFQKEGKVEIVGPGFYKMTNEYSILPPIPIKTFTENVLKRNFISKDGIQMSVSASLVWNVTEPSKTVLFPGSFQKLTADIKNRLDVNLVRLGKQYNRSELLPTKQDVVVQQGEVSDEALAEALRADLEKTNDMYRRIEKECKDAMVEASKASSWGVAIHSVKLEGFELRDERIIADLNQITQALLASKAEKAKGKLAMVQAEQAKIAAVKRAEAQNHVRIEEAKAAGVVAKTTAECDAAAQVAKARAENEIRVLIATTDAEADAKARKIKLEITKEEKLETAKVEAESTRLVAEANFYKVSKENEAASLMSQRQFDLALADRSVEAMNAMGNAAWRMPDKIMQFYESFSKYLRVGPTSAADLLKEMDVGLSVVKDARKGK